jgi:site-specific recombinase XerD
MNELFKLSPKFSFNLEKRKAGNGIVKTTNMPIRMAISYKGQRVILSTGFSVDNDFWNIETQRVKDKFVNKKGEAADKINSYLNKMSGYVHNVFTPFELSKTTPTPKEVTEAFKALKGKEDGTAQKQTLWDVFDTFTNKQGIKNNWTEATQTKFKTIKNHLQGFDPKLTFQAINEDKLQDFIAYLQDDKHDFSNGYILKNISFVKWFLRWTVENDYTKNDSFKAFKPKLKKVRDENIVFLTWDELMHLYNFQFTANYLDRVRDVFCFCCFTGLRYSDVFNLKHSDIKEGHISIITKKTTDSLFIPLNKYSKSILDKYSDVNFEGNKALPVISNQKMNEYLKAMAKDAGFEEPQTVTTFKGHERITDILPKYELIGTHTGRRTFITNSLTMGIPAEVVMKITGHSDYKAMKPYIKITQQATMAAMERFNNF